MMNLKVIIFPMSSLRFLIMLASFNFVPELQEFFVLAPRRVLHLLFLWFDHNCLLDEIMLVLIILTVDQRAIYVEVILDLVLGGELLEAPEEKFPSVLIVAVVRREIFVNVVKSY